MFDSAYHLQLVLEKSYTPASDSGKGNIEVGMK